MNNEDNLIANQPVNIANIKKPNKQNQKVLATQGFAGIGESVVPQFTGEGAKPLYQESGSYYAGTEKGEQYANAVQKRITKAISQGNREFLGKDVKLENNLTGVFDEAWRDINLTSFLARTTQKIGAIITPENNLSEEEFKNSPYYREGMQYNNAINLSIQKGMAERMDDRAREEEASNFRTGYQKAGYLLASFGASIVADPVGTALSAGFGVASKTLSSAFKVAFAEGTLTGIALGYANDMEFKSEGVNKSNKEILKEALFMGVVGGGVGFLGKGIGNKFSNIFNGKYIDKNFEKFNLADKKLALEKINRYELNRRDLEGAVNSKLSLDELLQIKGLKEGVKTPAVKPEAFETINDIINDINKAEFKADKLNTQDLIEKSPIIDTKYKKLNQLLGEKNVEKGINAIESGLISLNALTRDLKKGLSIDTIIQYQKNKSNPQFFSLPQETQKEILDLVAKNFFSSDDIKKIAKKINEGVSLEKIKEEQLIKLSNKEKLNKTPTQINNAKIQLLKDTLNLADFNNGNIQAIQKRDVDPNFLTSNKAVNSRGIVVDLPESINISDYKMSVKNLNINYKVVDYRDITYSNRPDGTINPNYEAKFQPRDRTNIIGLSVIRRQANNLDLNRLLFDLGSASSGMPLVKPDGMVIAGNGRMMSIELAYNLGKANDYSNKIKSLFPQADWDNIEFPVVVREILDDLTDLEFIELARKSNMPEVDSLTALERIKFDADILEDPTIANLYKGGSLNSKDNQSFYTAFLNQVAPKQLNNYIDQNGNLTLDGIKKIENAIIFNAYSRNETLINAMSVQEVSDVSRTLMKGFFEVAPEIYKTKTLIQNGLIPKEFDISENFSKAFTLIYANSDNYIEKVDLRDLAYHLKEPDIFGERLTDPLTEAILRGFFKKEETLEGILTAKEMKAYLKGYWTKAQEQFDVSFVGEKNKTPLEILNLAKENSLGGLVKKEIYNVPQEPEFASPTESKREIEQTDREINKEAEAISQAVRGELREGVKQSYRGVQTSATKEMITKKLALLNEEERLSINLDEFARGEYKVDANILNLALFKETAGEFRAKYPQATKNGKNLRDFASINQLKILDDMQIQHAKMIKEGLSPEERLSKLLDFVENEESRLSFNNPAGDKSVNPDLFEKEYAKIDKLYSEEAKAELKTAINQNLETQKKLVEYLNCIKGNNK